MASLTKTAYISRKTIKFGGLGLVALMIVWSGGGAAIRAWRLAHPPKSPPTVRYGLLPKIVFPKKEFEKKEFMAELKNDVFPQFDDQAKIFVIYRPDKDFMALEHDKKAAKQMGFVQEPAQVSEGVYQFRNDNLNQTLTMNVLSGSFVLKYPYTQDQTLLTSDSVPEKQKAIEEAMAFLKGADKLTVDLEEGEKKISYWKIEGEGLRAAGGRSEANVARVDFLRAKIDDEWEMVGNQPQAAPVSVLVSGDNLAAKRIVEVDYKTLNIDPESFSTYPIKSVEEAWEDLRRGNYWPAMDSSGQTVAIRNIKLAYFEPVVLTNFLQPVFVFEGSDNFAAYVSAVADSKIKQDQGE